MHMYHPPSPYVHTYDIVYIPTIPTLFSRLGTYEVALGLGLSDQAMGWLPLRFGIGKSY